MRYWLVMPAAGAGRRFGTPLPKQYAQLMGRAVIEWSLAPFLADRRCLGIVIALAPQDEHWAGIAPRLHGMVMTVAGGTQRSHSVRRALAALEGRAAMDHWVLVHDAVRPCLEEADLERLLAAAAAHTVGGLLAAAAADTLKRAVDPDAGSSLTPPAPATPAVATQAVATPAVVTPAVAETVERAGLWRALTPQMFRYGRLCRALDSAHAAGRSPTDESQALEWQGEQPLLVEGAASNLKVTTAADLVLASAVLRAQRGPGPCGSPSADTNPAKGAP